MFNAKTVENFISQDKCKEIIAVANSFDSWDYTDNNFWHNKTLNDLTVYKQRDKKLGVFLFNLRDAIAEQIKTQYSLKDDVYSDVQQIVRWYPGMEMHPHSDNMENTPHHDDHKHRAFGVVIYLNDDFVGGETYYPNHNIYIKPKAGMLAIHPSDIDHLHGVTKVENNIRYTIVSFWTFDSLKKQTILL